MKKFKTALAALAMASMMASTAFAGNWVNANGWEYHENGQRTVNRWVLGADNQSWFYTDSNGKMATGWFTANGKWYFAYGDGRMAANQWVQSDGSWYFLKADGSMAVKEWVKSPGDGKWYYVSQTGAMMRNLWVQSGADWYFIGSDGTMLTNANIGGYRVDETGRYVRENHTGSNGGSGGFGAASAASTSRTSHRSSGGSSGGNGGGRSGGSNGGGTSRSESDTDVSLTTGNSANAAVADKKDEIVNRKIMAGLRAYNKSGKSIDEMSDIEKAMLIVGYTNTLPYDVTTTTLSSNFEYTDSLYNALETNLGQCYHHALLAQRAGELIGIPVVQVFSNTGNQYSDHQYIAYNVDGDWYRADPTNCLISTHDANGTEINIVNATDVSARDKNDFDNPNGVYLAGGVTIMRMYANGNQTYKVPNIGALPTLADFQKSNKGHSMADFNDAMNFVKTGRHLAEDRTNEEATLWENYQENLRASGYTIEVFEEATRAESLAKADARKNELIGSGVTREEFCRVVDNYTMTSRPNLVFIKWMTPNH